jgi:hypothetical protein
MDTLETPRIVSVERLRSDVLLEFDDGTCALYTASLLLKMLPSAVRFEDNEPDGQLIA